MDIFKIWRNKGKIFEGIKNNLFKNEHIEAVALERLEICLKCPYFDLKGESEKAVVKGEPACAACGCKLLWKIRSLSSNCGLEELKQEPKWTAVMNDAEETLLKMSLNKPEE